MLKKRKQSLSSDLQKEIQTDKKEEAPMNQRIRRTKDDVKKIFLNSYLKKNKLDPTNEDIKTAGLTDSLTQLVEDLSERELANSTRLSKVIGQKVKFRELVGSEKEAVDKSDSTINASDSTSDDKNSISALKEIERKKAVEEFLPKILKEFKEEGLSSDVVYDSLQKVYREQEEDIRREDFKARLEEAFSIAYPTLFRERVRRQERQRLYEEDSPQSGGSSAALDLKKIQAGGRVPKHGKSQAIGDWYKKT